jgi:Domain of unknown function (DUF1707)
MTPNVRIGDRERADAAERLSEHHAAGRLDVDELERRIERVNAAVYSHELVSLEADLPRELAPRRRPAWPPLSIALIALGVAGSLAVGHPLVPLFVLAFFLAWRRRHGVFAYSGAGGIGLPARTASTTACASGRRYSSP